MSLRHLIIKPFDGLPCLEVPLYTLKRYAIYRIIFSAWAEWMISKTEWLGYLDLTAGPGYSTVKDKGLTNKQVAASPIIALQTKPRFTHLIFIEKNRKFYSALRKRIKGFCEGRECDVLNEDANEYVRYAVKRLEGHCLVCVDPFRPTDILWRTIKRILENDFCDLVGAYPAPLLQRSLGRFRNRLFVPGIHKHMPPGFKLNIEMNVLKASAAYCRSKIKEKFQRTCFHCFVRGMPYPVLFSTKENKLAEIIYNKLEMGGTCDEIIFDE